MNRIEQSIQAIRHIQAIDFSEQAALELIEVIRARVLLSNFHHTEYGQNVMESLDDAATYLRVAREDMLDEAGRKE